MKAIIQSRARNFTLEQSNERDLAADLYEAFGYVERGARSYDPVRIATALSRRPGLRVSIVHEEVIA